MGFMPVSAVTYIKGAAHSAEKAKRLVIVTTLGLMVFAGGEYVVYTHMTNVPITGRPHVVYVSRKEELKLKKDMVNYTIFRNPEMAGVMVLKGRTNAFIMIQRIISAMKRACIYFDPASRNYYERMNAFYLSAGNVNAFSSIGGFIVVFNGIIDHCFNQSNHTLEDTEERLAGVIAHEMGHAIARHPLESLFHISNFFYWAALLFTADGFVLPAIKEMADNRLSTKYEYEADLIGMYLMKRAGYSVEKYIETIGGLPDDSSFKNKTIMSFFSTHPSPQHRKEALLEALPKLEEDFCDQYSVDNTEFYYVNYYMYYCYSHLCKEFMV